ncbi:DNA gyrase inhibitor SbmC [Mangrovibacter yixingensis]|uniref:DNA gyrase inhibitor SbmC n=1 Tax=Mangrovibacter yixingensis TaxID=1529639 RepID=UPI001CFABFCF|nr:DNA gyrase inhibitor SbmC [Mangrovibacter yixingensis]
MMYQIRDVPVRHVAGFHLVGPWDVTVKQGFEQLMLWVRTQQLDPEEWVAAYYDNPDVVPPEKLRCATLIRVNADFTVPPASEGVICTALAGGTYAVASVQVDNNDFETPWRAFFTELLQDNYYQPDAKPCYEVYQNDGSQTGTWMIDMYVPVMNKPASV